MGEWIYRTSIEQDWVSLIFFINLLLILGIHFSEKNRLWNLLKVFSSNIYFSRYSSDQNLTFRGYFNLLSSLIILSNLTLLLRLVIEVIFHTPLYVFEFYYLLLGIALLGFVRFLIVQFVLKQINRLNKINIYLFKSFTYNTQFSILSSTFLFIGHYTHLTLEIILGFLLSLSLVLLLMQTRILVSFIKSYPKHIFYLIFYLCTIKIAPWIWFYLYFIESRL